LWDFEINPVLWMSLVFWCRSCHYISCLDDPVFIAVCHEMQHMMNAVLKEIFVLLRCLDSLVWNGPMALEMMCYASGLSTQLYWVVI
jgi:hypothetical protein